jgi:hypothetical protein
VKAPFEHPDSQWHERAIRSLSDRSGASVAQVRTLFSDEFARLKVGARVGSYLGVLTASNVRGMLRRKARLASDLMTTEKTAVSARIAQGAGLPAC